MRPELAWLNNERVRLVLLLAVLASLVVYALAVRTGPLGIGDGSAAGRGGCSAEEAPALASVSLTRLLALRSRLDRTMASFEPGIRAYGEGLVPATSAWTDAEPAGGGRRAPSAPWPASYEMRWWLRSGDDVVTDVFVFANPSRARGFFGSVRRPRCGSSKRVASAAPGFEAARNIQWRNPLGLDQEDVYLRRGRRVYRVLVVKPGADRASDARARRAAFAQIDGLVRRLGSRR